MADTIGVAMLGYAFMGKAHSRAFREAAFLEPALVPRLVSISGRTPEKVEEARRLLGWEEATTDWREQVQDDRVQLFDNGGPNDLHAEPTIEAARNGKHILCEKPLGRTADEARAIWSAAEEASVVHMCGFNYRFVPAVRLAREIVESGDLGDCSTSGPATSSPGESMRRPAGGSTAKRRARARWAISAPTSSTSAATSSVSRPR